MAFCGESGEVHSFEPDPYARELLQRSVLFNSNLKCPVVESRACSDTISNAILYSGGGNSQSSLDRSAVEHSGLQAEQICVETTTVDANVQQKCIRPPAWIKIDTEGAEIRVLNGGRHFLILMRKSFVSYTRTRGQSSEMIMKNLKLLLARQIEN